MGTVVPIEGSAREGRGKRPSKTALVLGGGGFTGGVYEIGALRALDLLAVDGTVNDFDLYVGTSAGSFIASLAANGVTPEEMMRVVAEQAPTPFRDVDLGTLLRPDYRDFVVRGLGLPFKLPGLARTVLSSWRELSIMDVLVGLAEWLPPGLYTGSGVEEYLREVLCETGRTNDFRHLRRPLYLTATDLDTCERIVLGGEGWDDVPISAAVAASTALPMVFKPVELKDRHLVDGGLRSTTNVDVAVEAGAKLIVVVNPIVPYVNDFQKRIPTIFGTRMRRVADLGFPYVGYQTFKLVLHQRLHELAAQWADRYPGVDIILIEPRPDDALMFGTNVMNFSSRVDIARHGFQSVTSHLAEEYERYREICARHGIQISRSRVEQAVSGVHEEAPEEDQRAAWRRVLEQTTGALLRSPGAS